MSDKHESEGAVSTSALAATLGKSSQGLFNQLAKMGLIVKNANTWDLTPTGKLKGGLYKKSDKYGKYIVWPQSIKAELDDSQPDVLKQLLSATAIGKHFGIPANRINSVLSELGWIKKHIKGWQITELGKRLGGIQAKDKTSGVPYVRWTESIMSNKILIINIRESKGDISTASQDQAQNANADEVEFREKFQAKHRAKDGHYVRSKAELLIDNWLYDSEVLHAYERKLPVEEDIYSDFYVPSGKVYIEYWGYEDDSKYLSRKERKREIYKKYDLKLI
ncbi:MAG: hypothetical protein PHY28_06805 [Dehalococcoidales bacterium]|nr:hypothetical protein [Dehalococcoidales bacterium]